MFTTDFGPLAYHGDSIKCEVDGFTVIATIHHDEDSGPPWKQSPDIYGVVSDWTDREADDDERELTCDRDWCGRVTGRRYYDMAASLIKAREVWGYEDEDEARDAVERDYEALRAWCHDEWRYIGVAVTVERDGVQLTGDYSHATWGIESIAGDYLTSVANDYLGPALADAKARIAKWAAQVQP